MIKYLQEQFFIHASSSAKKVMSHKGHQLKKNMPKNVSIKNSLRIARFRNKNKSINRVQELQKTAETHKEKTKKLEQEVSQLQDQIDNYHLQYGVSKLTTIPKTTKEQLQEIIHLQKEILEKQAQAKEAYHKHILSKEEYEKIHDLFEEKQNILRDKKKIILSS